MLENTDFTRSFREFISLYVLPYSVTVSKQFQVLKLLPSHMGFVSLNAGVRTVLSYFLLLYVYVPLDLFLSFSSWIGIFFSLTLGPVNSSL